LASRRCAYPCAMTRGEILEALAAPHGASREVRFPASLRPGSLPGSFDDQTTGWRFVTPERRVAFVDGFCGEQSLCPFETVGDFVIWTKQGMPAYQLAVVVDDARQGITDVVRGDDLLDSAARQRLLYEALGIESWPRQVHLPLVLGEDGRRLAKRHGDTRVEHYKVRGVGVERVIGLLGSWCGIGAPEAGMCGPRAAMDILTFCEGLDVSTMSTEPVVFTQEDEAWLLDG
jgi:glutamyl-tRNA synthetase